MKMSIALPQTPIWGAIVLIATAIALAAASGAKAEECYWDRAQQARVCHPSPSEREAWRRGREHGAREHEGFRWWPGHDFHPHWYHDERGRW